MLTSALRSFLTKGLLTEAELSCCAGGVVPVYKDGSFFESWQDVSFNAQVDYNQSREPSTLGLTQHHQQLCFKWAAFMSTTADLHLALRLDTGTPGDRA